MRRTITMVIMAAALVLTAMVGTAGAHGVDADQMERAGYFCFPVPDLGVHCLRESKMGSPSIPVMVFDSEGEHFQGTELLLRADIYSGQPCPQEGHDHWHLLDNGYYACHHY